MNTVSKLLEHSYIFEYLGVYSEEEYYVHLYDVPRKDINVLEFIIKTICNNKCKIIIVSPKEEITNILIIDIDL